MSSENPEHRRGRGGQGGASARGRRGGGRRNQDDNLQVRLSKLLSLVLRHRATELGIPIAANGFVAVSDLLAHPKFRPYTIEDIRSVVENNDKKRFELYQPPTDTGAQAPPAPAGWTIRAVQGHTLSTVEAALDGDMTALTASTAPAAAIHGTTQTAWKTIAREGLSRMSRHHVHLAAAPDVQRTVVGAPASTRSPLPSCPEMLRRLLSGPPTADSSVGGAISGLRRTASVFVFVDVRAAIRDGMPWFMSRNGVILSPGFEGIIPPKYFAAVLDRNYQSLIP